MGFDVKSFLTDCGIEYSSKGPKSTKGWVQIQCPFNDCSTEPDRMGIHASTGVFHCWHCRRKGPPALLVARLLGVNFREANDIVQRYDDDIIEKPFSVPSATKVEVKGLGLLQEMHRNYLIERNFDPDYLIRKYRIGGFGLHGRFPYRIGIPVYESNRLVNLTARDVTNQQDSRYLTLKNEESVIPIKQCVYNIDNAKSNILIVEGPFDAWRIGGSTVSLFGTEFKTAQILSILSKYPQNVFILFDEGAHQHASELANSFSPFVPHVEVLEISLKDPAMLDPNDALHIRHELGL